MDRVERSQLVSKSVHSSRCSFRVPTEISAAGHREWALLFPAWSMVLVLLTYFTYFSLALFATPAFSDISTITGASNSPGFSLSPVQPPGPDSSGRLLDPATFDFADEGAATEMYDIPITLVNRALYDRG